MNRLVRICALAVLASLGGCAAAASDSVDLPLHLVNGVPVVQLRIDGKDIPFTLDTGAADALYLDADAERAMPNLSRTGKRVKSMDLGGRVVEDEEIAVSDLVIDGMHFEALKGRTLTPWGPGRDGPAPPPRVSVIGLHFFDGKQVLFDLAAGRVTVRTDARAASDGPDHVAAWQNVPFELAKEGLLVTMDSANSHYRLALDSASTISLVKAGNVAPHDGVPGCEVHFMPGSPCVSVAVHLADGASGVTLYAVNLPDRFQADGMVGRAFFDTYRVYLDTQHHVLRVSPVQAH